MQRLTQNTLIAINSSNHNWKINRKKNPRCNGRHTTTHTRCALLWSDRCDFTVFSTLL